MDEDGADVVSYSAPANIVPLGPTQDSDIVLMDRCLISMPDDPALSRACGDLSSTGTCRATFPLSMAQPNHQHCIGDELYVHPFDGIKFTQRQTGAGLRF